MRDSYRVGEFVVEPLLNQLNGNDTVVVLEPKAIDLLVFFIQNPGKIASRAEIIDAVWGQITVSDHAVNRLISQLRKALGDNVQPYQYIETVAKRGYRLIADVEAITEQKPRNLLSIYGVILVLVCIFFVAGGHWVTHQTLKSFKPTGNIQVVTSLSGREWQPRQTADGMWLSFLHRDPVNGQHQLYIQAKGSAENYLLLSTDALVRTYSWLGQKHQLALSSFVNNRCKIEVFEFDHKAITLGEGKQVVDCGSKPVLKLAYSVFNQSLYWLSGEVSQTGDTRKVHLVSLFDKHADPGRSAVPQLNDVYDMAVSNDGNSLLLLTHYQWERSSIYHYDITNQQQRKVLDSNEVIRSISWARADQAMLFIENGVFRLMDLLGEDIQLGFGSDNRITGGYFSPSEEAFYYGRSAAKSTMYQAYPGNMKALEWGAQHNERNPTFAHDGKTLAFISMRGGDYKIWIRSAEGDLSALRTDNLDMYQTLVRWSPDDRYVLFHSFNAVYRYDLSNHTYRKISPGGIYADVVGWSYRDENTVYVRSDKDGQFNIWRLNITNQTMQKVTHDGGFSGNESADGQYLYYTKEQNDGLWRLNLNSDEHQVISPDFSRENHLSWYLVENTVYSLYANKQPAGLYRWHLNEKGHQQLWQAPMGYFGGFAYSPSQNISIWGLLQTGQWDIMKVKGTL